MREAKEVAMDSSKLQHELHKRCPFESPEQEAHLSLIRTADRLGLRFARLFAGYDLTSSQYNVLRILRGEGQPMRSMDIAARTVTEVPGITGLLDRLQERDPPLVCRSRCPKDRRVIHVEITEAGLALLLKLDQPVKDLHRQLLGHLTGEEIGELVRLLEKARGP